MLKCENLPRRNSTISGAQSNFSEMSTPLIKNATTVEPFTHLINSKIDFKTKFGTRIHSSGMCTTCCVRCTGDLCARVSETSPRQRPLGQRAPPPYPKNRDAPRKRSPWTETDPLYRDPPGLRPHRTDSR